MPDVRPAVRCFGIAEGEGGEMIRKLMVWYAWNRCEYYAGQYTIFGMESDLYLADKWESRYLRWANKGEKEPSCDK